LAEYETRDSQPFGAGCGLTGPGMEDKEADLLLSFADDGRYRVWIWFDWSAHLVLNRYV